jgi:hypothetical protein
MAHYAFIDSNNIVVKVLTGVDEDVTQDDNGTPVGGSTEAWEQFYENQPWHSGLTCKRTSYNATNGYRKQYAGIGYTFDADADVFVAPQRFPSWTLDSNYDWQPPTPYPTDGETYYWNEEELAWAGI